MKILAAAASLAVVAVTTFASAADNPIATRQNMMKSVGAAAGIATKMNRGELPYDAARAELALRTIFTAAAGYKFYFPEGSDKGDTAALPKIWQEKENFERLIAKLEAEALAAIPVAAQGADQFRDAFQKLAQNCGTCHETYRMKR